LTHQAIVLHQRGKPVAQTQSNDSGEFAFARVSGGVCQLAAGASTIVCRAWTSEAAPPVASDQVTIVASPHVVRGQQPLSVLSNPLFVGLIIAAAIAIPVAIHNAQDDAS